MSDGTYSDVRALSSTPIARSYDDRFVAYAPPSTAARTFAIRQLRATAVVRWEYAPGSALFVVWTHDREGDGTQTASSIDNDIRDLFRIPPVNTVTVKVSYWLGR